MPCVRIVSSRLYYYNGLNLMFSGGAVSEEIKARDLSRDHFERDAAMCQDGGDAEERKWRTTSALDSTERRRQEGDSAHARLRLHPVSNGNIGQRHRPHL